MTLRGQPSRTRHCPCAVRRQSSPQSGSTARWMASRTGGSGCSSRISPSLKVLYELDLVRAVSPSRATRRVPTHGCGPHRLRQRIALTGGATHRPHRRCRASSTPVGSRHPRGGLLLAPARARAAVCRSERARQIAGVSFASRKGCAGQCSATASLLNRPKPASRGLKVEIAVAHDRCCAVLSGVSASGEPHGRRREMSCVGEKTRVGGATAPHNEETRSFVGTAGHAPIAAVPFGAAGRRVSAQSRSDGIGGVSNHDAGQYGGAARTSRSSFGFVFREEQLFRSERNENAPSPFGCRSRIRESASLVFAD